MTSIEVPAEVYDLYRRLGEAAEPDGEWPPPVHLVSVLCRWFVDHGIRDLHAPLSAYRPAIAINPTTHQEGQR